MRAPPDLATVFTAQETFRDSFSTLILATVSDECRPEASYAPYVRDTDGRLYVYVSELSRHTANLKHQPRASVLFIESEQDSKHLFARQRLTYECHTREVERASERWQYILMQFETKFGKFMEMLRNLKDFHLFEIRPQRGTYVAGFAQAYGITGERLDSIRHLNDTGHRAADTATDQAMQQVTSQ
ncbi:MAG: pyridoxamine 5'-phosphate oxidase family protein [Thiogranum sp.]